MEPHAEQVFHFDAENKLCLNDTIFEILNHQEIANKKVCVVSIAGGFREGKSFIQNFLIRYLNLRYKMKTQDMFHWLDPKHGPISVFEFRAGPDAQTIGILMWSEIFLANLPSGEEVAIILMDTQGAFDTDTPGTECGIIFALSILISSVQIYNLHRRIGQDNLQHLQYFAGYGQLALENESETPFQKLLFLIRDWPNSLQKGGAEVLNAVLNTEKNKSEKLIELKNSIKESFEDIGCFLLPYPGKAVATSESFRGNIDEIDPDFRTQVEIFAPAILAPENLVLKAVNAQAISVKGFTDLLKIYWNCFKDGNLPPIDSLYLVTAEIHHTNAMHYAEDAYKKLMENCKCQEDATIVMSEVLETFRQRKKMGSSAIKKEYEERLIKELQEIFSKNYKNVIAAMQEAIDEYKRQLENCKSLEKANKIMTQVLETFSQRSEKESSTMRNKYKKLLIQELEELFSRNYRSAIEKYEKQQWWRRFFQISTIGGTITGTTVGAFVAGTEVATGVAISEGAMVAGLTTGGLGFVAVAVAVAATTWIRWSSAMKRKAIDNEPSVVEEDPVPEATNAVVEEIVLDNTECEVTDGERTEVIQAIRTTKVASVLSLDGSKEEFVSDSTECEVPEDERTESHSEEMLSCKQNSKQDVQSNGQDYVSFSN